MATPQTLAFLLYVFVVFLCVYDTDVVSGQLANFRKLELPEGVTGPAALAFRRLLLIQEGPFVGVADGRILKWKGPGIGFVDFAYTSPNRTKKLCDGTTNPDLGPICGKPLDLSFQPITGILYVADDYYGLLAVGPSGGLATQLVSGLRFTIGVAADIFGSVYFQTASNKYDIRDSTKPGFQPDSTGKFYCYNTLTGRVKVLLSNLSGGGGPAISDNGTFVLVPDIFSTRILKYWLVGPKANTAEVFLNVYGNPNKIKRAERSGEFWVAVSIGNIPRAPLVIPTAVLANSNGDVLDILSFEREFFNKSINVVYEHDRKLYVASRSPNVTFVGVYSNYRRV